jgi:hypothetical protein
VRITKGMPIRRTHRIMELALKVRFIVTSVLPRSVRER